MEQSDMWGCDQKGVQQRSTLNLVMHIRDSRNARYLNGSLPIQKLLMWRKMTGMSDDLSTTISLTLNDPDSITNPNDANCEDVRPRYTRSRSHYAPTTPEKHFQTSRMQFNLL